MAPKIKRPWQHIAQEAQDYRDSSIARFGSDFSQLPTTLPKNVFSTLRHNLSYEEIDLTEKPPEELLNLLAAGIVTATTVAMAFLRRASITQKLVRIE